MNTKIHNGKEKCEIQKKSDKKDFDRKVKDCGDFIFQYFQFKLTFFN